MDELKQQLYTLCGEYLANKESVIKSLMNDAQDAANEDTKSSAGDKYETGREVMQQEVELNRTRLNELNKFKLALEMIKADQKNDTAIPGALVQTNNGSYYIAISAGQLKQNGNTYYSISIESPIGAKMRGLKRGEHFMLNGRDFIIENIS